MTKIEVLNLVINGLPSIQFKLREYETAPGKF